jgi:hypothetical protein
MALLYIATLQFSTLDARNECHIVSTSGAEALFGFAPCGVLRFWGVSRLLGFSRLLEGGVPARRAAGAGRGADREGRHGPGGTGRLAGPGGPPGQAGPGWAGNRAGWGRVRPGGAGNRAGWGGPPGGVGVATGPGGAGHGGVEERSYCRHVPEGAVSVQSKERRVVGDFVGKN